MGANSRLTSNDDVRPSPHPPGCGRFVVSLDFELHWGVRHMWSVDEYRTNLIGAREVIPRLVELFVRRGIRATWSTVGLLMAEDRDALLESVPATRPKYRNPHLDPYAELAHLGSGEADDPFHFAPSLVALIAKAPGQEVATHTLSHFFALEPGASTEAFAADLDAALRLAERLGLSISSIVFPRNQVSREALRVCQSRGLTAFRGTERAWHHQPRPGRDLTAARALRLLDAYVSVGTHHLQPIHEVEGLVNIPASRFLRPCRGGAIGVLDGLRVSRIERAMSAAAKAGGLFHVWWHPHNFGAAPEANLALLERILDIYDRLAETAGLRSMTMREVASDYRRASDETATRDEWSQTF